MQEYVHDILVKNSENALEFKLVLSNPDVYHVSR